MSLLGVELSDAGILVAGSQPAQLLETDQSANSSPGYALPQKKQVLYGQAAEQMAHLFPQQILNLFWDQLSTEPLERAAGRNRNQAEVAYAHLKQIWEKVKAFGDCLAVAVPDHYTRNQLGLLLGMAQELGINIIGFSPLSIASASQPEPGEHLFYLDIHLHRMELTCLTQAKRLSHNDTMTMPGKGIIHWHREWVDAIATEFVHTTRFDPLHRAETEQALYNRLHGITAELNNSTTAKIELPAGQMTYRTAISAELLISKNTDSLNEIIGSIQQMQARWLPSNEAPLVLLISHRLAGFPGVARFLSDHLNIQVRELPKGAGALGMLAQWEDTENAKIGAEAVFQKSKPWAPVSSGSGAKKAGIETQGPLPTHLLFESVAYPIGNTPLVITHDQNSGQTEIHASSGTARRAGNSCSIERQGKEIFVNPQDMPEATLNGEQIQSKTILKLGDSIRLDPDGNITLKIIACLRSDET